MRRSRRAKWRALTLGFVHVAILAHVAHWLVAGRTVSPVEPSESMRTFELGEVNAGFVFFALALLSTAIFGRFFCGWGCHVVALQDLCAWLLKKAGVKPRPFRSRLLLWAPAALAFYMFAWPSVKRAFGAAAAPFPGFTNHLTTASFWATFPGVAIAIPFLLVCGFAVVLLLGSKGFCTYGCPYGGLFAPLDRFARGRIRVSDACNGCGHCTATCTSNVRVHEEVRVFKMVVDPGCMKCMDCVSVCPTDALSYGFQGPSLAAARKAAAVTEATAPRGARLPARRTDLSWRGEVGVASLAFAAFLALRGAYGIVPLLMAVGLALCVAYLAWTAARIATASRVTLHSWTLQSEGRPTRGGVALLVLAVFAVTATFHTGAIQALRWDAERLDRALTWTSSQAFAGELPPPGSADAARATRAAARYRQTDAIDAGGWGLFGDPQVAMRRAWLALVQGNRAEAELQLRRVVRRRPDEVGARDGLARVLLLEGRADEAIHEWREAIRALPTDPALHRGIADAFLRAGRVDDAIAALVIATNLAPADAEARAALERLRSFRSP